MLEGMTAL
jgi:TolA-binding protein